MNNFLVYKSSAGSGKTYTLMLNYLSIVLKEPVRYRNILAITFTNKAANEIKKRILSNLKLVSTLDEGNIPEKDRHLVDKLLKNTGLSMQAINSNAGKVLTEILHNYGDFAVSTIDSFVHRIIRSFSYDLRISMNFEVEMDTDMLTGLTVDELIADVGTDAGLTEVLVDYIKNRAQDDESWQIDRTLASFAKNLFDENAFRLVPEPAGLDAAQVKKNYKTISKIVDGYRQSLKEAGTSALKLIASQGLDESMFFQSGKGLPGFFGKLAKGELLSEAGTYAKKTIDEGKWLSAAGEKSPDKEKLLAITGRLAEYYRQAMELINSQGQRIALLEKIRSQLYPMSLLGELKSRLDQIKAERNVIPISEFNRIVAAIVMEEPVPFIYEKIGERYRHYMIDEFQDTSVLQWTNLMPLLENSLSQGGLNLVVGDGKQAIYRFRNGDVDQFVRLPDVDNPENNPLITRRAAVLEQEYKPDKLGTNFRSRREIVEFNNRFFGYVASRFLSGKKAVYDELEQDFDKDKTGGLVQIEFYTETDGDYTEYNLNRVYQQITSLLDEGYKPGDIAVLCRANREASAIAVDLTGHGIQVVSADSLLLKSSPEVIFLVNWLGLLNNPNQAIGRTAIVEYLFDNGLIKEESRAEAYRQAVEIKSFEELLSRSGLSVNIAAMRLLSLLDKVEELIRIFGLNERSPVYLQFFLDEILSFSTTNPGSLSGFLEYWERKRDTLSVMLPAGPDAVQVMTIHKSKGLEFPVVIYPFARQGKSSGGHPSVWVPLSDEELPDLKAVYLPVTKSALESTEYAYLLEEENEKRNLDFLNLVYVAFTRPSERLYVLTEGIDTGKSSDKQGFAGLFAEFIKNEGAGLSENQMYRYGSGTYMKGENYESQADKPKAEFHSYPWKDRLVFASRAPLQWNVKEADSARAAGNLLHFALSLIHDYRDKEKALEALSAEGLLNHESAEKFAALLDRIFSHEQARNFFGIGGKVFIESEILTPEGKSYRPDRVVAHDDHTDVIDFKSGKHEKFHGEQVKNYASLLREMGYPNPVPWLLYLDEEIEVVKIE